MKRKKVMAVIGTRPEAIKLSPVVHALRNHGQFDVTVVSTGQHREMVQQALAHFKLDPDRSFEIMKENQSLFDVSCGVLRSMECAIREDAPDVVMVQGDTTTAFATALAAFYLKVDVAHVEAGLRTGDHYNPFPEEMNRALIGRIAALHFAPTPRARDNLLAEGISEEQVFVTGNTVIDAVRWVLDSGRDLLPRQVVGLSLSGGRRVVLVTCHRRESFGKSIRDIFSSLARLAAMHRDIEIVFPVHPNPNVRRIADELLAGTERIHLVEPLDYLSFIAAMNASHLILTDSGGVQEEAPSLSKPVLVLRETTERPEGIAAGVARLVGTEPEAIITSVNRLLDDSLPDYAAMSTAVNPYGDGHASERIVDILSQYLGRHGQPNR
jgi:UDP-N-acetylglucosamine 2-epimerase (non-hydrolysing)